MSDALTMAGRCIRLSARTTDALLTSLMLPIMMMLMFVYLFGGAINTGTEYVDYVVPGVLVLCTGFGAAGTAVSVSQDMAGGIVDRLRSMDVGAPAILGGHVAASVARNAASTALVVAVALLIGYEPAAGVLDWAGAIGVLAAFVLAMSWLSAAIGLVTRSPEAANGLAFLLMFLPYPSSAFVPVSTMPSWLHGFALHQPATPIIESIRGFLTGSPDASSTWHALAWCAAIAVVSIAAAVRISGRRAR